MILHANISGNIPMPAPGESVLGGHAVVVAGFDDDIEIKNSAPDSPVALRY